MVRLVSLIGESGECQRNVMPTEPERIAQGMLKGHSPRALGDVVEVAVRVFVLQMPRWGQDLLLKSLNGKDCFHRRACTQQVSGQRFGRTNCRD